MAVISGFGGSCLFIFTYAAKMGGTTKKIVPDLCQGFFIEKGAQA